MRRFIIVAAGGAAIAVTAGSSLSSAATVQSASVESTATRAAVASPKVASGSSFTKAQHTFNSMKQTKYAHRSIKNVTTGYYQFDCVGFTMLNLAQSNPRAKAAFRKQARIALGRVGKPNQWYGFFTGQNGPLPSTWARISKVTSVRPGDCLAFTKGANRFVGHADVRMRGW